MLIWRKLSSARWEDAWRERLAFIDSRRIVVNVFAGGKTIRIDVYGLGKSAAKLLLKRFGGQLRELKKRDFLAENSALRPPLRIRGRLVIVRSSAEKTKQLLKSKRAQVLVIPAAMAFGTGDHATTAACLRFLADASETLAGTLWTMLDLGTGSGILALAARMLGAHSVDAADFDVDCLRTARENLVTNNLGRISFRRLDVTKWTPRRDWDIVTANLYSQVLITAAPQIARAVKPGGVLIFSGILREQESGCVRAFSAAGLPPKRLVRKGKWVTGLAFRTT